jgi:hypothetical protein
MSPDHRPFSDNPSADAELTVDVQFGLKWPINSVYGYVS